jgi:SAM-dependent methyltransferase
MATEHAAAAIGVDFSSKMIAAASQRYPALQFHEADAEVLPFSDGVFDAVFINFGVHHFPFPLRALSEAHRVLRANGRVAFTVWAAPDEHSLHKITLGALREAGVSGAALPTAPGGVVNDIASCLDLLRMSGFSVPHSHVEKIVASLWLDSEQHLIDMLVDGTVRMSTLIRTQTREKTAAIIAAIRMAAVAYREHGRLRIPVTAILAVGSKA